MQVCDPQIAYPLPPIPPPGSPPVTISYSIVDIERQQLIDDASSEKCCELPSWRRVLLTCFMVSIKYWVYTNRREIRSLFN